MSLRLSLLFFSLIATTFLTGQHELFKAQDFNKDGEFTSGIEGPAADGNGLVYAVNYKEQGTIGYVNEDAESGLFVHLPENSIGNGIRINRAGNLYIADYTNHNVLEIDVKTKKITVHAHNDNMNQPNDLAISSNGDLYLSDPNWKESTGNLWKVDTEGHVIQLESDMGTTNGIEVNPEENRLYVNESVQRQVWVYDLNKDGNISNKRLFFAFDDFGLDGMRCDVAGNLYITRHGKGTVAILSPQGEMIQEVVLKGKQPTNIAFGGPDGKTCYVTMMDRGCFEVFRTNLPGREWAWRQGTTKN